MKAIKWALVSLPTLALVAACTASPTDTRSSAVSPLDRSARFGLLDAEPVCPDCNAAIGGLQFEENDVFGDLSFNVAETTATDLSAVVLVLQEGEATPEFFVGSNLAVEFGPDPAATDETAVHIVGSLNSGFNFVNIDLTYNLVSNHYLLDVSGVNEGITGTGSSLFAEGQCTLFVPQ